MTNKKALVVVSFAVFALLVYVSLNPGGEKTSSVQKADTSPEENNEENASAPNATAEHQAIETVNDSLNRAIANGGEQKINASHEENNQENASISTTFAEPRTIESANYSLYLPGGMNYKVSHPIVVALSPSADAASMIRTWKPIADRHQWIVYASKTSKNGECIGTIMEQTLSDIGELEKEYPVNRSRIIFTGFSGGAMGSHAFAFYHPKNVSAVVANTGMIDEIQYKNETYLFFYPKNKTAVFIASPTDFRYEQMKKDKILLDGLGWKTKWIEFTGGHTIAPETSYEEAAEWLEGESA